MAFLNGKAQHRAALVIPCIDIRPGGNECLGSFGPPLRDGSRQQLSPDTRKQIQCGQDVIVGPLPHDDGQGPLAPFAHNADGYLGPRSRFGNPFYQPARQHIALSSGPRRRFGTLF